MGVSIQQSGTSTVTDRASCAHCNNPVPLDRKREDSENQFCCGGCQAVFHLLHDKGLSKYYELQKESEWLAASFPANWKGQNYSYLEDPTFLKEFIKIHPAGASLDFYLEGVHCIACLWLIEKLPEILPEVSFAKLDLGRSIATIVLKEGGSFKNVAEALSSFGYKAHPLKHDEEQEALEKKENKSLLIKMGIAAGCSGNIMLMAVSLYSGATAHTGRLFEWVSVFLFLPVLFYCALPFYQSCLSALKSRTLSIDIPVMMAVLAGSVVSFYNFFRGSPLIYFDSLSTLIFLLLCSRYVLKRIQQKVFSSSHLLNFLSPSQAKRFNSQTGNFEEISAFSLKAGDYIRVEQGETIPADGILRKNIASLSTAVLTGESNPVSLRIGEKIFAGSVNLGDFIDLEVTASGKGTRLASFLQEMERGQQHKANIVHFADRFARYFVWGVLALASLVFVYFLQSNPGEGLKRALTLVIVTCPCTFAFATPLALSLSLKKAARNGFIVKGADVLEKITQASSIILDKTGTLTEGNFEVIQWLELVQIQPSLKQVVHSLELPSKHPVAKALVRFTSGTETLNVEEFFEEIGKGVSGRIASDCYRIASKHSPRGAGNKNGNQIGVWKNNELVAQIILGDKLRSDSKESIAQFKTLGLSPHILSGDSEENVKKTGEDLGIEIAKQLPLASPEDKQEFIRQFPRGIMIGDGANDAPALSSAFVGIAVQGSMEASLRAADVYLSKQGLKPILQLIQISRDTLYVIQRNFAFSFFYNLLGGTLSILGFIHPLFAAVLMPLSSVTVVASSMWGTKTLRKL